MTKTNQGLSAWALSMAGQACWPSTACYPFTEALMHRKQGHYPAMFSEAALERCRADIAEGKRCADSYGLVKGYLWTDEGGTLRYGLSAVPDLVPEQALIAANVKGVLADMPDMLGVLLFGLGKIGVYVGSGEVVTAHGILTGIVREPVTAHAWSYYFLSQHVAYVDAAPKSPRQRKVSDRVAGQTGKTMENEAQATADQEAWQDTD